MFATKVEAAMKSVEHVLRDIPPGQEIFYLGGCLVAFIVVGWIFLK